MRASLSFSSWPSAIRFGAVPTGVAIPPIEAARRVFLTGTPIVNRPIELWPLVKSLDPEGLGASWQRFVRRYCAGTQTGFGWDVKGASNLEELQDRLRASIMVRRLKKDVLKDLPPKRRQIIVLQPEGEVAEMVGQEKAAWEKSQQILEELRAAAELAKAEGEEDGDQGEARAHVENRFNLPRGDGAPGGAGRPGRGSSCGV